MTSIALDMPAAREESKAVSSFAWFDIEADPPGWDELVRQTTQEMFHLRAVLRAHCHSRGQPIGIVFRRHDDLPIPVGGVLRMSAQNTRSFEALSFPPLMTTAEPGLVDALAEWLRSQKITDVQIGSFTGGVEGYSWSVDAVARERLEFVWDLRVPVEERFRALRSNHKRNLQKLLKMNLALKVIDRWQPEQMTWLRTQWARRRKLDLQFSQILQTYRYNRLLHKRLTRSGTGCLYGFYDQNQTLLSAAYMLEVDGTAFYMVGASSPAGYQLNASVRLFWELAELYSGRGYSFLNFGGAPSDAMSKEHVEHGVLRFKAGFGIEPVSRISLSIKNEE